MKHPLDYEGGKLLKRKIAANDVTNMNITKFAYAPQMTSFSKAASPKNRITKNTIYLFEKLSPNPSTIRTHTENKLTKGIQLVSQKGKFAGS